MTQETALKILKTGANVFLTGEPGAGKTHTINEYVRYLRGCGIEPAITASTGIAATHIGGMTIHSWSGIGIRTVLNRHDLVSISGNKNVAGRISKAQVLIIDEISMLAPNMVSMIDQVCREIKQSSEPFGGLQIVFIGDFFQLPPISKSPFSSRGDGGFNNSMFDDSAFFEEKPARFAYDSPAWAKANLTTCYLTEQHRQDDETFLGVLAAIRSNKFADTHLQHIQSRRILANEVSDKIPRLFSHNMDVDRINNEMLGKIVSSEKQFQMYASGPEYTVATLKKGCLSPEKLVLKVGASVMFTKNNQKEGFVNGTLGTVSGFNKTSGLPMVRVRGSRDIEVAAMDWMIEVDGTVLAKISQLPLRLAWAITVHKSQGMSLDEAVMDLSGVFEYGQGYVALSRVRRLSGLHLLGWNKRTFEVDPDVLSQDLAFRQASAISEKEFVDMLVEDLTALHNNFVTQSGGKLNKIKSGNIEGGASAPTSFFKVKIDKKKAFNGQRNLSKPLKPEKVNTYAQTLVLWQEGKNVAQIALARKLSSVTILGHIEQLVRDKKINASEISRILAPVAARSYSQIHKAFAESSDKKLAPIFDQFNGEFSYEDLRVVRMMAEG